MTPQDFVKEICTEQGIKLESLSYGYITRLTKGDVVRHMIGAHLDANNAAADRIACDKCACYAVLNSCNIPAVRHELLMHPVRRLGSVGGTGTWSQALDYFQQYGQKVVVKPNQGSNGRNLFLCSTITELEVAVQSIFETQPDAAISPFYDVKAEYRVFYAFGKCMFVYGKTTSEGGWMHNLSQGATAFELGCDNDNVSTKKAAIISLAKRAAEAIGINFATVDILELREGEQRERFPFAGEQRQRFPFASEQRQRPPFAGEQHEHPAFSNKLIVMEINAGVQARQLVEQKPHLHATMKEIYKRAIDAMFYSMPYSHTSPQKHAPKLEE